MKKSKGFTLIELLAVIVILAIIALIVVPQVIKILNKARMSSVEDSTYGIVKSAENYITEFMLKNNGELPNMSLTFSCGNDGCSLNEIDKLSSYNLTDLDKLNYKGTKATSGLVTIKENGNIEVNNVTINGFTCNYPIDEKAKCYTSDDLKDLLEINNISLTPSLNSIKVVLNISGNASKYEYSIDNVNYFESTDNTYTFNNLEASHEYTIYVRVSNDSKTKEASKVVKTLELSAPEITVEKEDTWTQSKTVTIKYPSGENLVYSYKIKSLDGNTILVDDTPVTEETTNMEVTENSLVVATVTLGSSSQSASEEVTNIDRTAPTIEVETNKTQATLNMSDLESGIESYCITNTNDINSCNFIETSLKQITETIEQSGTYYAFAKDKAGNISIFSEFTITTPDKLENRTYKSGEAITNFAGYNWHVIGETSENVTLLMDAGQIEDMAHCTDDTDESTDCGVSKGYYQYSWDKSLINSYLKNTLYSELKSKITNEIVPVSVCVDSSRVDGKATYGGYLKTEINNIAGASCNNDYETDYVRLISMSEYYNLSPYYSGTNTKYPNVSGITRLSTSSDYAEWLYCNSTKCGRSDGYWWTMTSYSYRASSIVSYAHYVYSDGRLNNTNGEYAHGVRPVITIKK